MSRFQFFLLLISLSLFYFFFLSGGPSTQTFRPPLRNGPHPPKINYLPGSFIRRIVAVGDLHGDIGNTRKVLRMADVVDEHDEWSGDVDYFVQTGDIVDRGDDTIELFHWMDELRGQAQATGGKVFSHMGNHEFMNAIGDWRYVPQSEIFTFGGISSRQEALASGWLASTWAANYTVTSRLPLHSSLGEPDTDYQPHHANPPYPASLSHAAISFVHGGLSPTYQELTPFPSRINELGVSLLRKLRTRDPIPEPHPPYPYPGLPSDSTPEEVRLYDDNGPLWYRGWAYQPEEVACPLVEDVLARTGTRRMVMGHTPDFDKMVSRCGGKILIIDTGISHAYGGVLSALSITYALQPTNEKTRWKERETIVALYEDRHEVFVDEEREITASF